jgi:dTDP-glucose 4,6-dehydratase
MKKNCVLITGGAGFIGSHMSEKFHRQGYQVLVLDNLFRGRRENIEHLLVGDNKLFPIDLIDQKVSVLLTYRPSIIIHYAAINGTQYFYDIPEKVAEVNSIGTYQLLKCLKDACGQAKDYKPFLVFASTSETYGEPFSIPSKETDVTYARVSEDRDSYAAAKLMSEFFVKLFAQSIGIEWMIFRIFNVYGPRMIGTKYGQVIPEFIQRLKGGEYPLNILGDGSHTRSFIYIDDHVELSYKCLTKAKKNEIYNIGNPVETSIRELGELVMKCMKLEPKFAFTEERKGDHKRRVPDISKVLSEIGEFKFITLEEGVNKILAK